MMALGLYYARCLNPTIFALVALLLIGYDLPKGLSQTRSQPGMRQVVRALDAEARPTDTIAVVDWRFSDDYVHPEEFGMRYYGFAGHPVVKISVHDLEDYARDVDRTPRWSRPAEPSSSASARLSTPSRATSSSKAACSTYASSGPEPPGSER